MEDVTEELLRGQRSTIQLKNLVNEEDDPYKKSQKADELIKNIIKSFTYVLERLHHTTADSDSGNNGDLSFSHGNSDNFLLSVKKNRRGSYKRKREEVTWTVLSSTFHDKHSWRKYGQKEIRNCKFPRSYFRCSRKYDQGCKAIKYVQMMDEEPHMCTTTYTGRHTCEEIQQVPPTKSYNHVKRRKALDPMSGDEGSTAALSGLDITKDKKEVFPVMYSLPDLRELDVGTIEITETNSLFCFNDV